MTAARGEAQRYFEDVVLQYDGEDCLIWPFCRVKGYAKMGPQGQNVGRYICRRDLRSATRGKNHTRHLCGKGNSGCVAPRHVIWGSPLENSSDRVLHEITGMTIPIMPPLTKLYK